MGYFCLRWRAHVCAGAHHRILTQPDGSRRLVGFNFSEEPSGGLLHFFEYDEQFRLLHKTTRLLQVRMHVLVRHVAQISHVWVYL